MKEAFPEPVWPDEAASNYVVQHALHNPGDPWVMQYSCRYKEPAFKKPCHWLFE